MIYQNPPQSLIDSIYGKIPKYSLNPELREEAFSLAEIIDKWLIVTNKLSHLKGKKLKDNRKEYQILERVTLEKTNLIYIKKPAALQQLIEYLASVNNDIFDMVEIVERKENTVEDAYRLQDAIKKRSRLKNEINKIFGDSRREVKVYKGI